MIRPDRRRRSLDEDRTDAVGTLPEAETSNTELNRDPHARQPASRELEGLGVREWVLPDVEGGSSRQAAQPVRALQAHPPAARCRGRAGRVQGRIPRPPLDLPAILEAESSRRVFGFDAFGTFPRSEVASADDLGFIDRFEAEAGDGYSRAEIAAYLDDKGFGNYELVEGDVRSTVPRVLDERPELRISLLHLDMDVYEPTNDAITMLEDRLVPGALLVVDDYGTVGGATQAIDELCARRHLSIEKLPLSHVPSFIVWH